MKDIISALVSVLCLDWVLRRCWETKDLTGVLMLDATLTDDFVIGSVDKSAVPHVQEER